MNNCLFTRRDLLKKIGYSGLVALTTSGLTGMISSCGHTSVNPAKRHELENRIPDKLPGHKIQPLHYYGLEGCMNGVNVGDQHFGYEYYPSWLKMRHGKSLSFWHIHHHWSRIPRGVGSAIGKMVVLAKQGIIPYLYHHCSHVYAVDSAGRSQNRKALNELVQGKFDKQIADDAALLRKFGEKNCGFLYRTMAEMNLIRVHPWAGNPDKFKKAWKKIWHIFDNEGTNEFATWVWAPYTPYVGQPNWLGAVEDYYPGDKYADRIGLIGYSLIKYGVYHSFKNLFERGYWHMLEHHGNKSLHIDEVGCHEYSGKPRWFKEMFETIKGWKRLEGMAVFDQTWSHNQDRNLDTRIKSSDGALAAYEQGMADDHMLGKIEYQTCLNTG